MKGNFPSHANHWVCFVSKDKCLCIPNTHKHTYICLCMRPFIHSDLGNSCLFWKAVEQDELHIYIMSLRNALKNTCSSLGGWVGSVGVPRKEHFCIVCSLL